MARIGGLPTSQLSGCVGWTLTWVMIACWVCAEANAQVELDRFFPAAVGAGQTTTIKAEGKFPSWPPMIHCDRTDIQISAQESSGSLQVTSAQDALPGVAWVRLDDGQAASKLVPLLIETVSPSVESEPNNRIAEAMKIDSPAVVSGRLEKSGDIDTYRIAASAGETLVVTVVAHRVLRSPMDTVMQLVDTNGNVLFQTDDDCGLDPQLAYPISTDGDYLVRVFAFPETPNSTIGYAGSQSFVYVLRATTTGMLDHVLPLVESAEKDETRVAGWSLPDKSEIRRLASTGISPVTVSVAEALGWYWQPPASVDNTTNLLESPDPNLVQSADRLPLIYSGHLREPGEVDRVRFPVAGGKRYQVTVESKRLGFLLDSVIRLVDPSGGDELAKNDDRGRNDYDAALEYQAKEDGLIELQISDLVDGNGPRHAYSVTVNEVRPHVILDVADDHFVVKTNGPTEIPVTISRRHGFDAKLEITAVGLPPGVVAEPVFSEAKGDSAKSVKLALTASQAGPFQGTFQIVARSVEPEGKESGESILAAFSLREEIRLTDLWLTVPKEKKED